MRRKIYYLSEDVEQNDRDYLNFLETLPTFKKIRDLCARYNYKLIPSYEDHNYVFYGESKKGIRRFEFYPAQFVIICPVETKENPKIEVSIYGNVDLSFELAREIADSLNDVIDIISEIKKIGVRDMAEALIDYHEGRFDR